jgi:hypothetical protein
VTRQPAPADPTRPHRIQSRPTVKGRTATDYRHLHGRQFSFARTEPFGGTVEWTYRFEPDGDTTLVTESYAVTKKLSPVGWFIIGVLFARKDRRRDLRAGMEQTLQRMRETVERHDRTAPTAPGAD